ncbi:hypothetical protein PoB_000063800 [Plakobranchus ocellatus]|uniref:C-type lectin domain-containing protein n=1 Tax=Plakobranchus ocellatus TaxID=259542 RepID=A0AAV3XUW6_9GAST|nr:hypothetical protein PoB_000063800 [Plakobranchus ocellatus]
MDGKKSNELVLKVANLEQSLIKTIRRKQLQFLGHICLHKGSEHLAVAGKIVSKRRRDLHPTRMSLLPILLLLGVSMIASVQGYPGYSETVLNGKKYFISKRRLPLSLAKRNARCKSIGAYLVKIDDPVEHKLLVGAVSRYKGWGPFFTGITDEGSEGRYYNFNDKSPAKYLKWKYFQPDNWWGREHCVEIWGSSLNDLRCERRGRHICEAA